MAPGTRSHYNTAVTRTLNCQLAALNASFVPNRTAADVHVSLASFCAAQGTISVAQYYCIVLGQTHPLGRHMHSFARHCRLLRRCCSRYSSSKPSSRYADRYGWSQYQQQQHLHVAIQCSGGRTLDVLVSCSTHMNSVLICQDMHCCTNGSNKPGNM